LYINELLMRLIERNSPYPELFDNYQQVLIALAQGQDCEVVLRCFEKQLLLHMGYALHWQTNMGEEFVPELNYQYIHGTGFVRVSQQVNHQQAVFDGLSLLNIAYDNYQAAQTRRAAKHLMRLAMMPLLGNKPIKSRELFYRAVK